MRCNSQEDNAYIDKLAANLIAAERKSMAPREVSVVRSDIPFCLGACMTVCLDHTRNPLFDIFRKGKADRDWALSVLIALGTDMLADDTSQSSLNRAVSVALLYLNLEVMEKKSPDALDIMNKKERDLVLGCKRDVIRFFAKRIKCPCLKEIYKKAKTETKSSSCYNCKQRFERTHLMTCHDCRVVLYCSKACQRASWPDHQLVCTTYQSKNPKDLPRCRTFLWLNEIWGCE